jgi:hypothetical protein
VGKKAGAPIICGVVSRPNSKPSILISVLYDVQISYPTSLDNAL